MNQIPIAAWFLMFAIAICCNVLFGYGIQNIKAERIPLLFIVSISFFFIVDIDSPRNGFIRVNPQNLASLVEFIRAH